MQGSIVRPICNCGASCLGAKVPATSLLAWGQLRTRSGSQGSQLNRKSDAAARDSFKMQGSMEHMLVLQDVVQIWGLSPWSSTPNHIVARSRLRDHFFSQASLHMRKSASALLIAALVLLAGVWGLLHGGSEFAFVQNVARSENSFQCRSHINQCLLGPWLQTSS